jgi:predicted nucleic acid-binding protein
LIGGRILDASAVVAFASGESIYAASLVWTAVEDGIVLVVPSTAIAAALARLPDKDHPALEVLLQLPVTVVDDLDVTRARAVGALGGDHLDAHALLCAQDRGWPLVTADAARYTGTRPAGVEIDQLP